MHQDRGAAGSARLARPAGIAALLVTKSVISHQGVRAMVNTRSKLRHIAILCACLIPIVSVAQSSDGWAALGEMLSGKTKRDAEESAKQSVMRETLMRAEIEAAQIAAENRRADDNVRNKLRYWWTRAGFSDVEAIELASAYEYTSAQAAITAQVRRKSVDETIGNVRAALDSYNFLLANQLLVGMDVVLREAPKSPVKSDAWNQFPDASVNQEAVEHANEAVRRANQPQ